MSLRLVPMLILTLWSATSEANGERTERARWTPSLGSGCSTGCEQCSEVNGCLKCDADHLLLLQRDFMSHKGECVQSCPASYYVEEDVYQKHSILKCLRCRIKHCDVCYDRSYCSRCKPPFLEYKGRCISACPSGLHYASYTKDCLQKVDCLVGSWSNWTECSRDGRTCGFKYGRQTRTLEILQAPSRDGRQCPTITGDERQCLIATRRCPDDQKRGAGNDRTGNDTESVVQEASAIRRAPPPDAHTEGGRAGSSRERLQPKPSSSSSRLSKPSATCNNGLPAAADGRPPSDAAPCHRARHGKQERRYSPPPPDARATSTNVRPAARLSDWPPATVAAALLRHDVSGGDGGGDDEDRALTATAVSTSTAVSAPPDAILQQPRVTDVKAAEYYNYYLTLLRQLQRQRGNRVSPSADGA